MNLAEQIIEDFVERTTAYIETKSKDISTSTGSCELPE